MKMMLKAYIHATGVLANARETVRADDGFVSAEHLGLAIAGIMLVGVLYIAFKNQIGTFVGDMFDKMNLGDTPTNP